ncbi:MAG: SHOCT domain-containing protein [Nitriliruptorales bacterium]|nr:SHOCT domain-containing protein [Nitriliruptorales bacterium]
MMWGPDFFWMFFVWLAATGLVVWLVYVLVRPDRREPQSRAQEILEERYARGEIDRDEFETRRRDLAKR